MLSKKERKSLIDLVRNTIYARLKGRKLPDFTPFSPLLEESRGAFVTLHKHGSLRGCIGLVEALKPLYKSVQEMAVAAAFRDPRFPPLSEGEFEQIDVEVSVMSPLKKISNVDEIEVGTHGIIVKKGFHQGLLLPQVATEQGWDRDTFLEHTCLKAGLHGGCWKELDTEIIVFSAEVFSEKDY
jgi:AmmeMemoRadiSam system protein A